MIGLNFSPIPTEKTPLNTQHLCCLTLHTWKQSKEQRNFYVTEFKVWSGNNDWTYLNNEISWCEKISSNEHSTLTLPMKDFVVRIILPNKKKQHRHNEIFPYCFWFTDLVISCTFDKSFWKVYEILNDLLMRYF